MEVSVRRVRPILATLVLCVSVSACGDKSPTAPTPPSTPTRVMVLEANLGFGNVEIGSSVTRELRIINTGTEALTVTGMNSPGAGAGGVFVASWTNGSIAPGTSQISVIRFTPTAAQTYGGTLTVNGNQTSGTNTIAISGAGIFPPRPTFSRSGVGDTVFDMPIDVARIQVVATYNGSSQNFVLRVGGRLLVNEIIGTCCGNTPRYEGTLLTGGGGVTEVRISSGVSWSIQEIR
jgi:hypothetical protein